LQPLVLMERGGIKSRGARALICNLHSRIGQRELDAVYTTLGWSRDEGRVEELSQVHGPGNVLLLRFECEHVNEMFVGFGGQGVKAEDVGARTAEEARHWLAADVPVGSHLADQLLIPLALAGGGSFRTVPLTDHSRTNIRLIEQFLPVRFDIEESGGVNAVRVVGVG
jgi:RNA 3'-terminal phosphate cyclase (ATP)